MSVLTDGAIIDSEPVGQPEVSAVGRRWATLGKALLPAILLAAVVASLMRANPVTVDDPVFTSPRQSVTWTAAEAWAQTGRPAISEPRLLTLPDGLGPALTPRDGASKADEILPKDFPLTVVGYAAALRIDPRVALAFNPISGALLLLATAGLTYELSRSPRAALFSSLFMLATVSFWNNSGASVASDTLGAAALIGGLAVLLRARDQPRWGLLAGILFAVAVGSRYTHIGPALVLLGVPVLFRRVGWRTGAMALLALVVGLLPMFAYHDWLYGSPLTTGYGLGDELFADRLRFEGRGLLSFDSGRFISHLQIYLFRPESLLLAGFASYGVYRSRRDLDLRAVAVAAGIVLVALFAYHGGQGTWGSDTFAVNASILRYLLPVFALASVFAGVALAQFDTDKLTFGVAALGLAITAALWTAWTGPGGFMSAAGQMENQRQSAATVAALTPDDALIVTRLGSKTFFPNRAAMSATLMLDGSRVITDREILVWEVVPTAEELADDLVVLVADDQSVFVHNDGRTPWLAPDDLDLIGERLAEVGHVLEPVGAIDLDLFAIRPV